MLLQQMITLMILMNNDVLGIVEQIYGAIGNAGHIQR